MKRNYYTHMQLHTHSHTHTHTHSTSIGRAGTFCVMSSVLEQLKVEGIVDLFFTIHSLRQQQPGLVQTYVSLITVKINSLRESCIYYIDEMGQTLPYQYCNNYWKSTNSKFMILLQCSHINSETTFLLISLVINRL